MSPCIGVGTSQALEFVVPEERDRLREGIREHRMKKERIVESKVEDVIFDDDARTADVEMTIRYYRTPVYIVKDRLEVQKWSFVGVGTGWLLSEREVTDITK